MPAYVFDKETNELVKVAGNAANADLKDMNVYSTEEKIVGTWIDGKPIYRKVIEAATSTNIDTTSWGIDTPLSCYGCAVYTNDDTYNFPVFGNNREIYSWRLSPSQLFCTSVGWDNSWINAKIVCEYTKTTD